MCYSKIQYVPFTTIKHVQICRFVEHIIKIQYTIWLPFVNNFLNYR